MLSEKRSGQAPSSRARMRGARSRGCLRKSAKSGWYRQFLCGTIIELAEIAVTYSTFAVRRRS